MAKESLKQRVEEQEADFRKRRDAARVAINALDHDSIRNDGERRRFFDAVYQRANGDAAGIPWADLAPKLQLVDWLSTNPGAGKSAVDVGCGLGDNAEAMAKAGYRTTAFDYSAEAIDWARQRFPASSVTYHPGDLLDLPGEWLQSFDLVHECYTIQSVPPSMHAALSQAVASLVAPGGTLLVITRTSTSPPHIDNGPPWPLAPQELDLFDSLGFERKWQTAYQVDRSGRMVPHMIIEWQRSG